MKQVAVPKLDTRKLPALSKLKMGEIGYPALYMQARKALEECVKVDEVKDISDKHSAIAHYANQIKDDSLLQYAKRIKLRAYERMGELLKEIPDGKERSKIAKDNHLSGATFSQAIRMQELPPRVRDKLIDQKIPASLLTIARYADEHSGNSSPSYQFLRYAQKEKSIQLTCEFQAYKVMEYLDSIVQDFSEYRLNDKREKVYSAASLGFAIDPDDARQADSYIDEIIDFLSDFQSKLRIGS